MVQTDRCTQYENIHVLNNTHRNFVSFLLHFVSFDSSNDVGFAFISAESDQQGQISLQLHEQRYSL